MSFFSPSFRPPSRHAPWPGARWACAGKEPSLEEVFADPVIHAVMERDGVSQAALRAAVGRAQTQLRRGLCPRCCAA